MPFPRRKNVTSCSGNVKCADIRGGSAFDANKLQGVQILVARSNGSIEVHETEPDGSVLRQLYTMSIPANSSDVRGLEFSSDQRSILSCSGSELKVCLPAFSIVKNSSNFITGVERDFRCLHRHNLIGSCGRRVVAAG